VRSLAVRGLDPCDGTAASVGDALSERVIRLGCDRAVTSGTFAHTRVLRSCSRCLVKDARIMVKFLLWLLLLAVCWPLALLAVVLYPLVWLLSLPFRLVGITLSAVFEFLRALLFLPARLLGARPA
jgi:hypothetical protein